MLAWFGHPVDPNAWFQDPYESVMSESQEDMVTLAGGFHPTVLKQNPRDSATTVDLLIQSDDRVVIVHRLASDSTLNHYLPVAVHPDDTLGHQDQFGTFIEHI